jgi:hypothetical protein
MLPETQQLNLEWLFLTIYNLLHGGNVDFSAFSALVAELWVWIVVIGYVLSALALGVIVYCTVKLFDLRKREHHFLDTLIPDPSVSNDKHPRWEHIQSLLAGSTVSQWREAIIEADIMLDEVLRNAGYAGETLADKLKVAHFHSVQDAWEGHKVRNRIAHDGSAFEISQALAQRTIAYYESVFREFEVI